MIIRVDEVVISVFFIWGFKNYMFLVEIVVTGVDEVIYCCYFKHSFFLVEIMVIGANEFI